MREDLRKELSGIMDADGRLTRLPSKRKKKLVALCALAERIPAEAVYTEREFNAFLNTLHTFHDPATLRREMYDYYLIERDLRGSHYTVSPNRPTADELIEKYCK